MGSSAVTAQSQAVLQVDSLIKSFNGIRALDGVTLELRAGECLGLLGPNGAGKTTLVRSIVGRVIPDSGSITVAGNIAGSPAARATIGYVPQELAVYPLLTARENLATFGRYAGLKGKALQEATDWCLEWASLRDRANDASKNFSGGMKRRLNMAAGLIHRAPIVLLDEPTVGVDPQSRERIYEMIEHLKQGGTSIIYTSHYMEEVERLCDRVAIIDTGRIIAEGSPSELVRRTFGTRAELIVHTKHSSAADEWCSRFGGVRTDGEIRIPIAKPVDDLPELLRSAAAANVELHDFSLQTPNLQAVFLQLTGKDLRE
ncbi:MAG TPA: ABC transporter ATP-binding protein [Terriglobales bacterium]|nr:ABC transporter ATP-binding protein [Terriglobales bacterium]